MYLHWSNELRQAVLPSNTDIFAVSNLAPCTFFGREVLGQGHAGGHALLLSPDAWHVSTLRLYCGSQYRRDLSLHDALAFWIKSVGSMAASDSDDLALTLGNWEHSSNTVRIRDYMIDGVVGEEWRRVEIPLDALRTNAWGLGDSAQIVWHNVTSCSFSARPRCSARQ